jgi:hypothetical protein
MFYRSGWLRCDVSISIWFQFWVMFSWCWRVLVFLSDCKVFGSVLWNSAVLMFGEWDRWDCFKISVWILDLGKDLGIMLVLRCCWAFEGNPVYLLCSSIIISYTIL